MVAHLLRLKIALLRNSLRRSTMQLVGLAIGALYGLGILGTALVGLAVLGTQGPEVVGTVLVLAGSALFLGWLIIPVVASGLDMTLDPARFSTYSIPMRQLLAGLALSGFIGIPGAITLLASMGTAAAWWQHPGAAAVALFCGAVAALTCVVASRAITAASASLASSRKFKDLSGVVLLVPLVLLGPITTSLTAGVQGVRDYLPDLANTLSWTPLGAVWAVPAAVAAGQWAAAGGKLAIALAALAVLTWIWKACLAKALVTPPHAGNLRRSAGNLGFFRLFAASPAGAVAARSLTYWFRDPRYSAGLIIAPLLPLVFVFASSQAAGGGSTGVVLGLGGALAAFLVVWSISSDISYDNTAFALHLGAGVPGAADRAGRAAAAGILALALGILYALAGAVISGSWALLPATLGLTIGAVGSGLGLASVFSARFTMNAPLPGDSPLKSKPGNNFSAMVVQFSGFAGVGVLVVPELVLTTIALAGNRPALGWISLATGAVLGAVFLAAGLRIGARLYDRRAPELLLAVSADR
ncbi:ABC-2 type transport system permease protein [Arthrobacter silviterrae]|uniref:Transporter n=1 Tax=Arthrobacter silviterrae TaxID=2026658 RepID=A0ABX0DA25_9MICC|nr:transporter [Arthrobacter silviterrae]MDQ0276936.1 ABC-2 type transport system permease protein [Arthrobacter silviterrae]NGN82725.1 transporter [Arthrobacter silviterrae]